MDRDPDPFRQKITKPVALARTILKMIKTMNRAGPGAGHDQAVTGMRDPAVQHQLGYFGVELQREGRTVPERLMGKIFTLGQQNARFRHAETLPVPLINVIRPIQQFSALLCGSDRIIAMLHAALGVRADFRPQMQGKHLRAKANSKEGFIFLQGNADPVNFTADKIIDVVGALRSAKNDRPRVAFKSFWERVSIPRTPDIELEAIGMKPVAHMTWG